jgi:acylphosphatase
VRGRVQGVGYRFHVLRWADSLGIVGWVANEPDGSVRCVSEGHVEDLQRLLAELRGGPPGAQVDTVEAEWQAPLGDFTSFGVRAGYHRGD